MCEAEALILAVEKYPCLWNIHDKDYHNRDVKDLAWEHVFKDVLKDWDTYSKVDKENKGTDLKKKWTHIRDYFRREFQKNKNAPTGSAAKKVKKYIYSDLLYFLIPVFDKRNTEGNYQEEESETQEQIDEHTHTTIQPLSPVPTPDVSTAGACSLKRNKKDIPTEILNILYKNQQKFNQKRQEVEDDDTKFLLSFRTHMKHMKENQKIEFKLGMLQLVKKINTENCSSSSSPLNYDNFSDRSVTPASSRGEYSPSFSYIPVPGSSSNILYKTPSPLPTFSSSSLQNKTTNYQSASSNSRVVINSITHLPQLQPNVSYVQTDGPRRTEHEETTIRHHYTSPSTSIHEDNLQRDEDTEAATFLVIQSQEQDENNRKYLNYK